MKKVILIALMAVVPASAFAVTPGDFIGGIFNFILDHIDKGSNGQINTNAKVILQSNNQNIILGRVYLAKSAGDTDTVNFPNCGPNSKNERVDALRLRVGEANAYVNNVKVTFQNGTSQTFAVNDQFAKGSNSGWVDLNGANRCVRSIRAKGQAMGGAKVTYTALTFVGRLSN